MKLSEEAFGALVGVAHPFTRRIAVERGNGRAGN
jgi:hypothetical protein